jgi:hypothetical protein
MKLDYPLATFFRHQELWSDDYCKRDTANFEGHVLDLSRVPASEADVLKVRSMMLAEGAPDGLDGKWGKLFCFVKMYWSSHVDELRKAGLVRLNDGTVAVVTPQLLAALHEIFLPDPPPMPKDVSVASVVELARRIHAERGNPET